jgi:hypothetical protein
VGKAFSQSHFSARLSVLNPYAALPPSPSWHIFHSLASSSFPWVSSPHHSPCHLTRKKVIEMEFGLEIPLFSIRAEHEKPQTKAPQQTQTVRTFKPSTIYQSCKEEKCQSKAPRSRLIMALGTTLVRPSRSLFCGARRKRLPCRAGVSDYIDY